MLLPCYVVILVDVFRRSPIVIAHGHETQHGIIQAVD